MSINEALFVCGFPNVFSRLEIPGAGRLRGLGRFKRSEKTSEKGRNGGGICRKKEEKKLVVRMDIGCNGLWVRRGCGSRLCEIEGKEGGGEEGKEGGVGADEAPSTTP